MGLIKESELIRLLREERVEEFNERTQHGPIDLSNADLRMVDLRGANLSKANLRGAYLKNADLRGLDLTNADLYGASLHDARIGGCFFPPNIDPQEIELSVVYGTRMRVRA
jgi:uncharacterized protein YjbI with pentapeptide repeats